MTGWILCVITRIREDVFKKVQNHHHIQVNTVIKSLFSGSTEKELYENLDKLWSNYITLNNKNDPFDSNEFIWNSKDISYGNSSIGIKNTPYNLPKFLVL